jgi:TRAP transporter TAXI family solute receptor
MDPNPRKENVGATLPATTIIAATAAVAAIVIGAMVYVFLSGRTSDRQIVIATGPVSGTYYALGTALDAILEADGVASSVQVLNTEGSSHNMDLIGAGRADLAIVQSDTPANSRVRLIAPLYDEHLHILVASPVADDIRSIYDLRGRRVSLGNVGSGTRQSADTLLAHFEIEVGQDLAMPPAELVQGFHEGRVDAAFILTAIPSLIVEQLVQRDIVRFLSLGDPQEIGNEADALQLVHPALRVSVIPRLTYGRYPEQPVLTVGVNAQLIASEDLDDDLVKRIAQELFGRRSSLVVSEGGLTVAQRIRERYRPESSIIPYHPGAVDYYTRKEPPFVVEYAETMSLMLTLLVGAYSAYIALREWTRRRRKNRIDAYYVEATRHFDDDVSVSVDSLIDRRAALVGLRRAAFRDLVNERLDANESFTILQDQIDSELRSIEALVRERTKTAARPEVNR